MKGSGRGLISATILVFAGWTGVHYKILSIVGLWAEIRTQGLPLRFPPRCILSNARSGDVRRI